MGRLHGYRLTEMALPAVVWALHLVTVYSMAGLACAQGWQRAHWAGLELVTWLIGGVTLASWAALGVIAWTAWRGRRALPALDEASDPVYKRRRFMSTLTLAMSGAAALATAINVIPVLLLPTCAG